MFKEYRPAVTGRKVDKVLRGARDVFLRDGYHGASVDEIAREAAVSKATLYSYFPDKAQLFEAVFRQMMGGAIWELDRLITADLPIDEVLRFTGHLIASQYLSEAGHRALRLAIAEAPRFPMLGEAFYESSSVRLHRLFESQFRIWQQEGMLRNDLDDLTLAADCFILLCAARLRDKVLLVGRMHVDDALIHRTVENAVQVFLRAYGTPDAIALLDAPPQKARA